MIDLGNLTYPQILDTPFLNLPHTAQASFAGIRARYQEIYLIISPPRSSSTAFSRVFWEHPAISYYNHEPFEVTYYQDATWQTALQKLQKSLDLQVIKLNKAPLQAERLVVKEMPYQIGRYFPLFSSIVSHPILFLICDPRLNIASRIAKKQEVGDSPFFPLIETGWELLAAHINHCQQQDIPYLIVNTKDFRNHPHTIFPQIFKALNLDFDPQMLSWQGRDDIKLDNLGGAHRHLYTHVLNSQGLEPFTETPPQLDTFPSTQGLHAHVAYCLEIYTQLGRDPSRVLP